MLALIADGLAPAIGARLHLSPATIRSYPPHALRQGALPPRAGRGRGHAPGRRSSAADFRALHAGEPFVIPNPWDAGSARVLADLGFEALATTSSGFAFTLGRLDGDVTLTRSSRTHRARARPPTLPVSVDLENGYGPRRRRRARGRARGRGRRGRRVDRGLRPRAGCLYERTRPPSGSPPRRGGRTRSASSSPPAPRTTSAATPTSTTRSRGCRPTSARAPTSSTRPGCGRVEEIAAVPPRSAGR